MSPRFARRRGRGFRVLGWAFVMILLLGAAAVGALLFWATRPGPGTAQPSVSEWAGSEAPHAAAKRLAELGLIDNPRLFTLYFRWFASGVSVQAGPHLLRGDLSARELVQRLARLPSRPRKRVTLPEGYTHLQIAERLQGAEICGARELRRASLDSELLRELGIQGNSAEGYLFPSTYELFVDSNPAQTVRQMVQEARKRLARLDAHTGGKLDSLLAARGWTERDVLTLASIVEREARAFDERPLIASVFYNRLDDATFRPARMLQSDATAAYGCQVAPELAPSCAAYRGRVTSEMLRDPANPYNTYWHAGLPRGPIGNPGEGAIAAVLSPARTDYLYFVADGKGRHRFSRTFQEHRRAITGND